MTEVNEIEGGIEVPLHITKQMERDARSGIVARCCEQRFKIVMVDGMPQKKLISESSVVFTKQRP